MKIRAVFMRGGTSKAIVFRRCDLPGDPHERDRVFLRALGSPDPTGRQLDGLGGGVSSLSKVCIVGPPTRPDADVDYTFVQVPVTGGAPDYSANCGNMSSAIGPFAIAEGLVSATDDQAVVRIHNTNTGKIIESRFAMRNGKPLEWGDFVNPGVAGSGAPISLDFLDPGGAATGRLLPGGHEAEYLEDPALGQPVKVSLVDATNAVVFVPADEVGISGYELPEVLEANIELMRHLETIRCIGSLRMGLTMDIGAARQMPASPKVAIVAPPRNYKTSAGDPVDAGSFDVSIRFISMGQAHRAITLTGAMCAAVAAGITGSCVANALLRPSAETLRIGHSSGILSAFARVTRRHGAWHAERATVFRTARRLMEGHVLVPPPSIRSQSGDAK